MKYTIPETTFEDQIYSLFICKNPPVVKETDLNNIYKTFDKNKDGDVSYFRKYEHYSLYNSDFAVDTKTFEEKIFQAFKSHAFCINKRNPVFVIEEVFNKVLSETLDYAYGNQELQEKRFEYFKSLVNVMNRIIEDEEIHWKDEDGNDYQPNYSYDQRLVKIEDTYYIVWCAEFGGAALGLGTTKDFKEFVRLENPFIPFNRNGVLFPIHRGIWFWKVIYCFETVAKEAQRQLNETFSAFIRNFLPKYGEAKADHIENLSTPIIIDQSRLGGNSRSTLGTITDINSYLRALYSRFGSTYIGKANMFSFNDINGMCSECEGLGKKLVPNMDEILDMNKSLNEGAILLSGFGVGSWHWKIFDQSGYFDNDKKIKDYTKEELEKFLYGESHKIQIDETGTTNITYEGLMNKFNRLYLGKQGDTSEATKKKLSKLLIEDKCPLCQGRRLHQRVYDCLINGYNITDLTSM